MADQTSTEEDSFNAAFSSFRKSKPSSRPSTSLKSSTSTTSTASISSSTTNENGNKNENNINITNPIKDNDNLSNTKNPNQKNFRRHKIQNSDSDSDSDSDEIGTRNSSRNIHNNNNSSELKVRGMGGTSLATDSTNASTSANKRSRVESIIVESATEAATQRSQITEDVRSVSGLYIDKSREEERRFAEDRDKRRKEVAEYSATHSDKIYRGQSAVQHQVGVQGKTVVGPCRAPSHIRISCRFDYQPDVCKDYKETGFCGFGDACKFLHMREDYKSGWQIDRDYDEEQKRKSSSNLDGDSNTENYEIPQQDELPWACFICREPFRNPVVTNCGHYFCESCALNHCRKSRKCFCCGQVTGGIFNTASKIVERMKLGDKKPTNPPQGTSFPSTGDHANGEGLLLPLSDPTTKNDSSSGGFEQQSAIRRLADGADRVNDDEGDTDAAVMADVSRELAAEKKRNRFGAEQGWAYPSDFADSRKGRSSWL